MITKLALICCLVILPSVWSINSPEEWQALANSHTIINNVLKPVKGDAVNCGSNGYLYPAKLLYTKDQKEKDVVVKVYSDNAVGDTEFGIYNILDAIKAPNSAPKQVEPEQFGVPAVYYYGEYQGHKLMAITPMEKTLADLKSEFTPPKSKSKTSSPKGKGKGKAKASPSPGESSAHGSHGNTTSYELDDDPFSMEEFEFEWENYSPEQKKLSANIIKIIRDIVWATKYVHSKAIVHTNISPESICFHGDRAYLTHFQKAHKMTDTSQLEVGKDDWKSFLDCFSKILDIRLEWALHDPEDLPDAEAVKKQLVIKGVEIKLPDKEKSPILYISVIYDLINKLIRGEVRDHRDRFDPATHSVLRGFTHCSLYDLSDLFFKDYVTPDYNHMDMVCNKALMTHTDDFGSIHYSWVHLNESTTAGMGDIEMLIELAEAFPDPAMGTLDKIFQNAENAYPEAPNPDELFRADLFAGATHTA